MPSLCVTFSQKIPIFVFFFIRKTFITHSMKQCFTLLLLAVELASSRGRKVEARELSNIIQLNSALLDGSLDAKDARGTEFELVPDGTPILPGQTRLIALSPKADAKTPPPAPAYPLASKGTLDWDRGSFKISAEFRQ